MGGDKAACPVLRPNPRCGGVTVNGATPALCEVHMLPWGHDRADHGWLGDTVAPDPTGRDNTDSPVSP